MSACIYTSVSWHLNDLIKDLTNEYSVVNDYDCIDIALSNVVAQLQQVDLFVGEVMRHIGKHGHAYVNGRNGDECVFTVQ